MNPHRYSHTSDCGDCLLSIRSLRTEIAGFASQVLSKSDPAELTFDMRPIKYFCGRTMLADMWNKA